MQTLHYCSFRLHLINIKPIRRRNIYGRDLHTAYCTQHMNSRHPPIDAVRLKNIHIYIFHCSGLCIETRIKWPTTSFFSIDHVHSLKNVVLPFTFQKLGTHRHISQSLRHFNDTLCHYCCSSTKYTPGNCDGRGKLYRTGV